MLAIGLVVIICFFLWGTFGNIFKSIFSLKTNLVETQFIGLIITNSITTLLSLFLPINFYLLPVFIFISILIFMKKRAEVPFFLNKLMAKRAVVFCTLPFLSIALLEVLKSPITYDTNLYHLQAIKWIREFPVIPGLANLHDRFGFNPNIFTFFSMTTMPKIFEQSIFGVNFSIYILLTFYFVNELFTRFKKEGLSNFFFFDLVLFYMFIALKSSPITSPDFLSISLPIFIASRLNVHFSKNNRPSFTALLPIIIICIYAITVKLSTIPLLSILALLFIIYRKKIWRRTGLISFFALIVLAPWLIRNIILSGWLIYPVAIDLFNFEWEVPINVLENTKTSITGWARNPSLDYYKAAAEMSIGEWFPFWWENLGQRNQRWLIIAGLAPLLLIFKTLRVKKISNLSLIVVCTYSIGVLFMLAFAPDFRFGKSYVVILAASSLLFLNFKLKISWEPKFKNNYVFYSILLIVFYNNNQMGYNPKRLIQENKRYAYLPKAIEVTNPTGIDSFSVEKQIIYFSKQDDRCFDFKLPCTPSQLKTVKLRGSTLNSGFKFEK